MLFSRASINVEMRVISDSIREHLQIEHQVQMLLEILGHAHRRVRQRDAGGELPVDLRHAPLDLAHLVEILAQPRAVRRR